MSRISRIIRLQTGHEPRLPQTSLAHALQNVCPHGIKAAPFFLTMHTQQSTSPSTSAPPPPPSSASSISLINDTLNGLSSCCCTALNSLSAANAVMGRDGLGQPVIQAEQLGRGARKRRPNPKYVMNELAMHGVVERNVLEVVATANCRAEE